MSIFCVVMLKTTTANTDRVSWPDLSYFAYVHALFTVDSRYLGFGYLEKPLISKRKSDPCFNIEI